MARPDLTEAALQAAIEESTVEGVLALFDGATETDRARMRPLLDRTRYGHHRHGEDRERREARRLRQKAADLAAGGPATVLEEVRWADDELVAQALGARDPAFLRSLSAEARSLDHLDYRIARRLIRLGFLPGPKELGPGFVRGMWFGLATDVDELIASLVAEPELLELVWQYVETPGMISGDRSASWIPALAQLAATGHLDRTRLLDGCLDAASYDARPSDLAWFASFVGALRPTSAEVAERGPVVVGLLGSPNAAVAKMALGLAGVLQPTGGIAPIELADALRAPLARDRKNLATLALGLLDRTAKATADDERDDVLVVMATGLGHVRADVAETALALMERATKGRPSVALRAELLGWVDLVPATLQARVAALAGIDETVAAAPRLTPVRSSDLPSVVQPGPEVWLADDRLLEPIVDLHELVQAWAAVLEDAVGPDQVERVVHGTLRLCGERPPGFDDLVSPLRKRAGRITDRSDRSEGAWALEDVLMAWTDSRPWGPLTPRGRTPFGSLRAAAQRMANRDVEPYDAFLRGRMAEVAAALLAGTGREALAEPTHRGGFVHPAVLTERRCRLGSGLGPYDQRQAALRSPGAPGGTPGPIRWSMTPDGYGQAVQTVVASNQPVDLDPLLRGAIAYLRKVGARRWTLHHEGWTKTDSAPPLHLAVPQAPEVAIGFSLETGSRDSLGWLVDPGMPLTGPAIALLAGALADSATRQAAAVDVAIAAIHTGRFHAVEVGRTLADLRLAEMYPLLRLPSGLLPVAQASPVHAAQVRTMLLALLGRLGTQVPKDLHAPLEVLAELSVDGVVLTPEARRTLEALAARTTKAGKAAKAILSAAN